MPPFIFPLASKGKGRLFNAYYFFLNNAIRSANVFFLITNQKRENFVFIVLSPFVVKSNNDHVEAAVLSFTPSSSSINLGLPFV